MAATALFGCSELFDLTAFSDNEIVDVNIDGAQSVVTLGSQFNVVASGRDSTGAELDITGIGSWDAADQTIIQLLGQGSFSAVGVGSTFIRVVMDGVADGVNVQVVNPSPPATAPATVTISNEQSASLDVDWSALPGATAYKVYRDSSAMGPFTLLVFDGGLTGFTDGGLASSTTYFYKVLGSNTFGDGPLSAAASGTTTGGPPPPTPTGLLVGAPTLSSLDVSWNTASGATGYEVYRDTSAMGPFTTLVYDSTGISFTDTSLSSSTTYYYKVLAKNAGGNSALSTAASDTTGGVPPTPAGLAIGTITLSSLDVSWNSEPIATAYEVYRDTSAMGPFTTLVFDAAGTSFTDGGLPGGTTYYYKVLAKNAWGNSPLSADVNGTTGQLPPIPAGLIVSNPTASTLDLSWNAATGATGYEVYRDTSAMGPFTTLVFDAATTSFTDTALIDGTTYYYRVLAKNAYGSSGLSTDASNTTLTLPATPTGLLVGTPTLSSLDVTWNTATGATGYELYRDVNATGAFTTLVYAGPATTYTNAALPMGAVYYYKVLATNGAGSSPLSAAAWDRVAFNGGFETGDFTGWTVTDIALPFVPVTIVDTVGPPPDSTPWYGFAMAAPEGAMEFLTGWDGDGPGVIRLEQDLDVGGSTELRFQYRAGWDLLNYGATMNRTFTVHIEPAGGGAPLQSEVVLTAPWGNETPDTGWTPVLVNVAAFTDTSVRVVFEWWIPEPSVGPAEFQLDDILFN